jgi:broad specificity phosphatase PhoE
MTDMCSRCPGWARRLAAATGLTLVTLFGSPALAIQSSEGELAQRLRDVGQVLLIRHAEAPGTGDPEAFRVGDCSTQRNLSEAGRDQARAIGAWLRDRGVARARVFSSQWCRCLETAELLGMGPVEELPALNSFYQRPADREPNLEALDVFLAAQPPDGELLVLVTHQVTISAVSGEFVRSGRGVIKTLGRDGVLDQAALVGFGQ